MRAAKASAIVTTMTEPAMWRCWSDARQVSALWLTAAIEYIEQQRTL